MPEARRYPWVESTGETVITKERVVGVLKPN
jgi:hypothetical protein